MFGANLTDIVLETKHSNVIEGVGVAEQLAFLTVDHEAEELLGRRIW